MAIRTQSLLVTTTRQQITIADTDSMAGQRVWIYGEFHGSSNKIAIGGTDVTIANGIHVYGGEKFGPIEMASGETLHVISDSAGGLDVRVMTQGS